MILNLVPCNIVLRTLSQNHLVDTYNNNLNFSHCLQLDPVEVFQLVSQRLPIRISITRSRKKNPLKSDNTVEAIDLTISHHHMVLPPDPRILLGSTVKLSAGTSQCSLRPSCRILPWMQEISHSEFTNICIYTLPHF